MDWSHYRFRVTWDLAARPDDVFAALANAQTYPAWWPQVREVRQLDERTGAAVFRSFLPYRLHVTARVAREDPAAGILQAALGGDLTGWVRWTVTARGSGTRVLFEQEVDVTRPSLRLLALPGRPFFTANHAWMMRGGRRGLAALLRPEGDDTV